MLQAGARLRIPSTQYLLAIFIDERIARGLRRYNSFCRQLWLGCFSFVDMLWCRTRARSEDDRSHHDHGFSIAHLRSAEFDASIVAPSSRDIQGFGTTSSIASQLMLRSFCPVGTS
jgi:hypothetical protein